MYIAYQPEVEIAEIRKVDEWHLLPPLPGKAVRQPSCEDEVSAWLSADLRDYIMRDLAKEAAADATPRATSLEHRFLDQAQRWEDETSHLSSPSQRMMHPSYQAILGMGQDHRNEIIDLMIRDMQQNRRQWFWALSYLAQDNPIQPEDAGRIDRMINAWVQWRARQRR